MAEDVAGMGKVAFKALVFCIIHQIIQDARGVHGYSWGRF